MIESTELTQIQKIRIECVKVAFRHDRNAVDVLAKAKEFEGYITGGAKSVEVTGEAQTDGQADTDSPV
jgi:hypothetical protein